jgi:hypothetical protein
MESGVTPGSVTGHLPSPEARAQGAQLATELSRRSNGSDRRDEFRTSQAGGGPAQRLMCAASRGCCCS